MTSKKLININAIVNIAVMLLLIVIQTLAGYFLTKGFLFPAIAEQNLNVEQAFFLGGTVIIAFPILCIIIDWAVLTPINNYFDKRIRKLFDEEWEQTHTSILREVGSRCPCAGVVSQEHCKVCGLFNGMFGGDVKCGYLEITNEVD